MTSPIDELVASLNPVHEDEITSEPCGAAGRALLADVTTGETPAPRRRRLPRRARVAIGGALLAGAAAATVVVLSGQDSGPLRSYANAAVRIDVEGDGYEVEIKDAYAGQEEFREAFAKVGLNARLSIVPVSPAREREIIRVGSLPDSGGGPVPPGGVRGTFTTVLDCPPGRDACPLRVRLGGALFRHEGGEIVIGRKARPGEVYADATPARGDHPESLRLTGRTVGEALADLRRRGLTASFSLGEFKADGSGYMRNAPAGWQPDAGRRVTGAWMRSSNSIGLLITPANSDPKPDPAG
ncbi:hypothetical protein [Actinomadura madurae]|uniref:hypothetical protein n=1 Tax=Actinomadura madurae TaxID=1993 RepID=UPI0020D21A46|nr:hypothetical protein [Actinomadura madurae]MCP9953844.1 hypothetical protein [Actinomadura madurae]MCP9983066.1 hypothetical protein [Actinomadura madurae]MCQ0005375.1 hypothetical protein [Actinomadura madurae]